MNVISILIVNKTKGQLNNSKILLVSIKYLLD